jgi:hypothetical protein
MNRILNFCGLMVLALLCFGVNAQDGKQFFVSPSGSDSHPGTLELPFHTISKARDAVRSVNAKAKSDITVFLRNGTYTIGSTLQFDEKDGGSAEHKVRYCAYNDEVPVISGGVRLSDWQPAGNGLWKTSANGADFRQLYINGKRAVRARTPDKGNYNENLMWDVKAQEILLDARHIKQWDNFKNVELIVNMNWGEAIMRMDSYSLSSDEPYSWHTPSHARVQVQEPERHLVFARHFPPKRNELAWYLENAMEFLDSPGEWYLNKTEGTLYYYPMPGEDMASADAIIPLVETLLTVKGTLDNPVKNLVFSGITFSHTTWLKANHAGALNLQACNYTVAPTKGNEQFVERCAAAVVVEAAHNCRFEKNTFTQLGASGLDLHFGTRACLVNENIFVDIAANGIQLAKFSDPDKEIHLPYNPGDERELCVGDSLINNIVTRVGQDYTGAVGIACGYPREVQIQHNKLSELPYSGISVGWGWTSEGNAMRGNIISNNHIHNVCQVMCDCGGIYTLSAQPGTQIKENYIHHVEHAPWAGKTHNTGIYLDEGSKGILIENNVISNISRDVPFVLKGESVFKNNSGNKPEVIERAGINDGLKK